MTVDIEVPFTEVGPPSLDALVQSICDETGLPSVTVRTWFGGGTVATVARVRLEKCRRDREVRGVWILAAPAPSTPPSASGCRSARLAGSGPARGLPVPRRGDAR